MPSTLMQQLFADNPDLQQLLADYQSSKTTVTTTKGLDDAAQVQLITAQTAKTGTQLTYDAAKTDALNKAHALIDAITAEISPTPPPNPPSLGAQPVAGGGEGGKPPSSTPVPNSNN